MNIVKFESWLKNEHGLTRPDHYISAIKTISKQLTKMGHLTNHESIFDINDEIRLMKLGELYFTITENVEKNKRSHNYYSAPFDKYIMYVKSSQKNINSNDEPIFAKVSGKIRINNKSIEISWNSENEKHSHIEKIPNGFKPLVIEGKVVIVGEKILAPENDFDLILEKVIMNDFFTYETLEKQILFLDPTINEEEIYYNLQFLESNFIYKFLHYDDIQINENNIKKIWMCRRDIYESIDQNTLNIICALTYGSNVYEDYFLGLKNIITLNEETYGLNITDIILEKSLNELDDLGLLQKNSKGLYRFKPLAHEKKLTSENIVSANSKTHSGSTEEIKDIISLYLEENRRANIFQILNDVRDTYPDIYIKNISRILTTNPNLFKKKNDDWLLNESTFSDEDLGRELIQFMLRGKLIIKDDEFTENQIINYMENNNITAYSKRLRKIMNKLPHKNLFKVIGKKNETIFSFKSNSIENTIETYHNYCPCCNSIIDDKNFKKDYMFIKESTSSHIAYAKDDIHIKWLKSNDLYNENTILTKINLDMLFSSIMNKTPFKDKYILKNNFIF